MPIEIYIAILVASACLLLLTVSLLVAGLYFKVRMSAMEKQVTQLQGDVTGLIHDSQDFLRKLQQLTVRATGAMDDVNHITRTASSWTDRADRVVDAVARIAEQPAMLASRYARYSRGFLSGVTQALLTPNHKD